MVQGKPTIIIICGPTAVGKTAVAIQLAKNLNTKIISADSRQCYKELNIGVAKPTVEELADIQHYFINSHSINEEVNAAVFEAYALNAAEEIFKEKDVAVMVGGTGLYIKAFCEGMDNIPITPAEIREEINSNYKQKGLEWLQSEVQKKDLAYWQTGEQKNPHRLIRALEVVTSTGKSINEFKQGNKAERPFRTIKVGLGLSKEQLYENINSRVDKMLSAGLVNEAKALIPYQNYRALQTVGYRELFEYFSNNTSLEQATIDIKTNSRQYAKRQLTWFKRDDEIKWFGVGQSINEELKDYIQKETTN